MCVRSQGRYVTHVELQKPASGGLGFSVVGLKSENRGELGIFIQEIQPGSVADWYVRINMPSFKGPWEHLETSVLIKILSQRKSTFQKVFQHLANCWIRIKELEKFWESYNLAILPKRQGWRFYNLLHIIYCLDCGFQMFSSNSNYVSGRQNISELTKHLYK